MSRTESRESPRPIATFRKTRSVAIQWAVVSAVGFFGFAYGFAHVLAAIRGTSLEPIVIPAFAPSDALVWIALSVGLVALVVVPHELLHGAFMARYGGRPTYGVGVSHFLLPYAYAETARTNYTRNQLLVVLLAPFVGITTVGLAAMVVYPSSLLVVPLAANAAGSIGDLWMAAVLWQYPADVRVAPLADGDTQGFGIYGSSDRAVERGTGVRLLSTVAAGAVGTLAACSIALVGAVFLSLAAGSGTVVLGSSDGQWLLFRHELDPQAGAVHLEIGAALWLAVGALGGCCWAVAVGCYRSLGSA
ncbi:DUF3267 domain-containing protein [Natronorubrum texcoconense]|uniref:Putative zincin peptidase n=1 Tax=Natronorubrum texcoconense TaxID=1095776 RepID=A0A1G8X976_9EURY|nr:DUF3267 domain-containing protein [Natronorubrum texcoconense]SDJ87208.1 Putative zincin peptidase [Natronorubrum texcoconense]